MVFGYRVQGAGVRGRVHVLGRKVLRYRIQYARVQMQGAGQ
jgi:hypothetical protein